MSPLFATTPATTLPSRPALLSFLALVPIFLAAALGCRSTTDNQIDLLERELRTQEDYIYELESYVVEYSEKLRDSRCGYPQQTAIYAEAVPEPAPAPRRSKQPAQRKSNQKEKIRAADDDDLPSPAESQPLPETSPQEFAPEEMEVPDEIELEFEDPLSGRQKARPLRQVAAVESASQSADEGLLFIPDPVDFESSPLASPAAVFDDEQFAQQSFEDEAVEETVGEEETVAVADRVADRLEVKQLFQGEGDESLLTVVEGLDAKGEPVDLDGEISLLVMTADQSAPRRLKRWNFTAAETVAAWQSSDLGDGLHLELPLDKLQLPATPLELWVRLVASDGRKLLTQLPFDASQLRSLAADSADPQPAGLAQSPAAAPDDVVAGPSATSIKTAQMDTKSLPLSKKLEVADSEQPSSKPRWRASMQRSDRTATGFAATAGQSKGWQAQAPGRQPYVPARVARAALSADSRPVASQPPSQPVWTSGRSVSPAAAPTTAGRPVNDSPAAWSSSR